MPIHFRNTPVNEPFTFDSIGNHWNQERIWRPKGYPHYHYLQTEKGIGRIEIQKKEYRLHEGEGILVAPMVSHSYERETPEWTTRFATFTGTIECGIAQMLGSRPVIITEKEQSARIGALIDDIMNKYDNPPPDAKSLSIDCYCLLMNFADGIYTRELRNDPLYKRYVEPAVKEIETHYGTELTVRELSARLYITPQYLSRLFGRFLGCSAYEYLTIYRINKAKELLLTNPRMEVQKIAQQVGFLDTSHFIAMFRKMTGITPLEYRKFN